MSLLVVLWKAVAILKVFSQAIEVKENVQVRESDSPARSRITPHVRQASSGMTGTVMTEDAEFREASSRSCSGYSIPGGCDLMTWVHS